MQPEKHLKNPAVKQNVNQLSGLVVVSTLRLGGCGFDPQLSHTRDYKGGLPIKTSPIKGGNF